MDKLEQIKKRIEEIQAKSAMAPEMKTFITLVLSVVSKSKEELMNMSAENIKKINDAVSYMVGENKKMMSHVTQETSAYHKKEVVAKMDQTLKEIKGMCEDVMHKEQSLEEMKGMCEDMMMKKPKDGKPADETIIVSKVLSKIKLPVYKETVLDDGSEIKAKLESLSGEERLDASAIKNLPEIIQTGVRGVRTKVFTDGVTMTGDGTLANPLESTATGSGDVVGPATNSDLYIPQWDGVDSKTLKNGLAVPAGGLAGITALNLKAPADSPTFTTKVTGSFLTASEMLITNTSKEVVSAPIATYPSLVELAYIKGLTSAIQTQLNGKQASMGADDNYVTDAQLIVIQNTSGTNTGDSASIPIGYLDTSTSLGTSDVKVPSQNAVKVYTDSILGTANALVYKGVIDCSANPNYPAADAGFLYVVSVAGKIGGASGVDVEVGDMAICNTDSTASGNQATVGAYWNVIQKNIIGAVTGPASSTDNNVAFFDSTTGKVIKDSGLTLSGSNTGDNSANSSSLALAGGTMSGAITLGENTSIALDPAGSADGKYSGITVTGVAGYTQAFGDCVYLDPTDSRWEACDANAAAGADGDSRGVIGIVVVAGTDGNPCTILLHGIIRADAKFDTFTINNPIYVSETAGAITQTQPITTDVVIRIVAFALTADEIYWNPENDFITHI